MYSIVGGGIGGLTTALAFEKLGIPYQLYEKADVLTPVGSGILLPPNALQVFEWLGVLNDLMKQGNSMKRISLTKHNMSPLFDYIQDDVKERFGYYAISIHRWELQKVLLKKLPQDKLHLGKSFVRYIPLKDKLELEFQDGSSVKTDFLIGADGIHSKIRKQLFPKSELRYSGQTCWRGICDDKNAWEDYQYRGIEMWGKQVRFGITMIEKNRFYWFAVIKSAPQQNDIPGTIKERLAKTFVDFHPMVRKLIYQTPEESIIRSDLNDVKPMPYWYRENICLLGDAAHATTPNMGQGGAQAIEDAYFLATTIANNKPTNCFKAFQEKRVKKVNLIVRRSRLMGIMGHLKNFVGLRNFMLKTIPKSILKSQWSAIYKLNKI